MTIEKKYGMHGKMLSVDLSKETCTDIEIDQDMIKLLLGGRGLGAALLHDVVPAKADPFGPDNALIFTTGPLTGSRSPTSNRYCLVTKSPLTGQYVYSISGGYFGAELKKK